MLKKDQDFYEKYDLIVMNIMKEDFVKYILKRLLVHDPYTYWHSVSVARLSVYIADSLGLSAKIIREVGISAILHDIGKLYIPVRILRKKDTLTNDEFDMIKKHPLIGAGMIMECGEYSYPIIKGVRNHHLNLDGSGYGPDRQRNMDLYERIIRIADSYDAMTDDRVYKCAINDTRAINLLNRDKGNVYDPNLLDLFISDGLQYKVVKPVFAVC